MPARHGGHRLSSLASAGILLIKIERPFGIVSRVRKLSRFKSIKHDIWTVRCDLVGNHFSYQLEAEIRGISVTGRLDIT
jgi:hypothetical protein